MDSQEQKEYRALVRGAATYILLGDENPPTNALELVQIYKLDHAIVNAHMDAIVQSKRRKVGGASEATDQSSADNPLAPRKCWVARRGDPAGGIAAVRFTVNARGRYSPYAC